VLRNARQLLASGVMWHNNTTAETIILTKETDE